MFFNKKIRWKFVELFKNLQQMKLINCDNDFNQKFFKKKTIFEIKIHWLKTFQKKTVFKIKIHQSRFQKKTKSGFNQFEYKKQRFFFKQNKFDLLLIICKSYEFYKNSQITNHFFEQLINEKTKNFIWWINQSVWNDVAKKKFKIENFINLFNNTKFNY